MGCGSQMEVLDEEADTPRYHSLGKTTSKAKCNVAIEIKHITIISQFSFTVLSLWELLSCNSS
jgi:hypothetical protein